ncbi:MAG: hypothetical protein F6J92_22625 [Symploca sp. SIO1A3]|nr:hypothetical protein [Symploca sp. SIO1A3]
MDKASRLLKALISLGRAFGTTNSDLIERVEQLDEDQATVLKEMAELRLNTIAQGQQAQQPEE